MFLILFLLLLQIESPSAYAGEVPSSTAAQDTNGEKAKEEKELERRTCLETCRKKAKELPTCHDVACKKDNQAQIKKCEDACAPNKNAPPCVSKCIDSAKAQEGPCSENPTCLKNITAEFQTCVQSCKRAETTVEAEAAHT
jgi:hypothetical protein